MLVELLGGMVRTVPHAAPIVESSPPINMRALRVFKLNVDDSQPSWSVMAFKQYPNLNSFKMGEGRVDFQPDVRSTSAYLDA